MWSGNVKTAIANLRNSKWRSLLTMTGVIIGITLVVTIVSLGEGLKHQIVGQVNKLGSDVLTIRSGKLVSRNSGGQISNINVLAFLNSSTLTAKDVSALRQSPSVTQVTPMDFVTSNVSSDSAELNDAFVIGTSADLPDLLHQKVYYGGFFSADDTDQRSAVIGSEVAHRLFGELNPVGHSLTIAGQNFIVQGVLAPTSGGLLSVGQTDFNSSVFIPFDVAKQLTSGTNILQILVKSQEPGADTAAQAVRKTLLASHNQNEDFSVLKQEELLSVVNSVVDKLAGFISAIAAISLLVGGIGIMDIMLASVSERTREIGIRKAVGATNRQIRNQFLVEGLTLSVIGGMIGVLLSLLVFGLLRLYTNLYPVITLPIMTLAVVVSVAVGVIFSTAPAVKAARKDPINALRGD